MGAGSATKSILLVIGCAGIATATALSAGECESHTLTPEFISFFHLQGSEAEDPAGDADHDLLTSGTEERLWTDPLNPDTDGDELLDGSDPMPVSQAVIDWGDPLFTSGDFYEYAAPPWWGAAFKRGGAWREEPAAWCTSTNGASLVVDFDREHLDADMLVTLRWSGDATAYCEVFLVDSNGIPCAKLAKPLTLLHAVEPSEFAVPILTTTAATTLEMRFFGHDVCVEGTVIAPLPDIYTVDPSFWDMAPEDGEVLPVADPRDTDTEGTGTEGSSTGSRPTGGRVIYVDKAYGSASYSGLRRTPKGNDGPRASIRDAIKNIARAGDTVVIAAGIYKEGENVFLGANDIRLIPQGHVLIR